METGLQLIPTAQSVLNGILILVIRMMKTTKPGYLQRMLSSRSSSPAGFLQMPGSSISEEMETLIRIMRQPRILWKSPERMTQLPIRLRIRLQ